MTALAASSGGFRATAASATDRAPVCPARASTGAGPTTS